MNDRDLKNRLYEQFARVGGSLSSPARLELLDVLAQGERSVDVLADRAALSVANTSRHLQILRDAGLVLTRRQGLRVFYRLAEPGVFDLLAALRSLAERRLAEVDRIASEYFGARDEFEPVTRPELIERTRAGRVIVLDVRPAEEFAAGHIPGAVSIPFDELERRLGEVPKGREVVAYCRGPYCVWSHRAVGTLRASGRKARRLVDGFPEWNAEGLPVESESSEVSR
ncbi:MAG: metalloregulator ArsR/SmtB family transcription factor [Blastocatellia bacterium]